MLLNYLPTRLALSGQTAASLLLLAVVIAIAGAFARQAFGRTARRSQLAC